ncbi:MAG: hypothetical protein JW395_0676 [Nitrospira sp.]|nr:hypothetical protein [Nitrospira sp.]
MSSALVYHHLGLGDHFILNGLVRHHASRYDRIGLFAKPHNVISVAAMFRDLPQVSIISGDDQSSERYIMRNRFTLRRNRFSDVIRIGFSHLDHASGETFEEQFYAQAGLPLSAKWDLFHIERDTDREEVLAKKVNLSSRHAFVHEDVSRGYGIDRSRITSSLPVFLPETSLTENILDYCGIILKATELHVIDSAFMFLIDCLTYDASDQKLFVHRYARKNPEWTLPVLKKNWTILV